MGQPKLHAEVNSMTMKRLAAMDGNGLLGNLTVFVYIVIAVTVFTAADTHADSPCAAGRRSAELPACLQGIRNASTSLSKFWFGSSYATRCPPSQRFTMDCFNLDPTPRTLEDKVFWPGTFYPQNIARYLDLTFTSGSGEYTGCDHHYKQTTAFSFSTDPLSDVAYETWHYRSLPAMQWTYQSSERFTLLVIDVGHGFIHGLYTNIPENDINRSNKIKPYSGPLNFRQVPNVYAFMLFNQTMENITVGQHWIDVLRNPLQKFNVSDFIKHNGLQGPVAMNWLLATHDPWSVEQQRTRGISDNCASFVQKTLQNHSRPFIPSRPNLKVFLHMTIQTPSVSFTFCCKDYVYPAKTVTLDPIGNSKVQAANVRTKDSTITMELRMKKIFPNRMTDFIGKVYTLICVDPDVSSPAAGTQERPLAHLLIINIANADMTTGKVMRSYRGPAPPDDKPHFYYFLLYEQSMTLNLTDENLKKYFAPNSERYQFQVTNFTSYYNLTLVGASWMVSENDAFVNYYWSQSGVQNEDAYCSGKPGYAKPCKPTSEGATGYLVSLLSLGIGLLLCNIN